MPVAAAKTSYYIVRMLNRFRQLVVCATLAAVAPVLPAMADPAGGLRLLMIEQSGCSYCVAFNRDIAPIYEKTELGAAAPLFHADLREDMPDGISLARLTGFPGEDFFWPFVEDMITQAQESLDQSALN